MRERFTYLDGLRGWAAFSVFIGHFLGAFYPLLSGQRFLLPVLSLPLIELFMDGDFCVCLFFVLSGFVLTQRYFATETFDTSLATAKRYFRLGLPVLASIVIAYLILRFGFFRNQQAAVLSSSGWLAKSFQFTPSGWQALWQGLYGVFAGHQQADWYNPVLWTIRIELLGSFLLFALVSIFGQLRRPFVMYGVLILLFLHSYYLGFVLGMLLAQAYVRLKEVELQHLVSLGINVTLAGIVLAGDLVYRHISLANTDWRVTIHILAAFALMLLCVRSKLAKGFLHTRPSQFLGRVSFALYLTHFLIVFSFSSQLYVILRNLDWPNWAALLLTFNLSLGVVLGVSYYFARFVDEPSTRLSGRIGKFILHPRAGAIAIRRRLPMRLAPFGASAR